MKIKILNFFTFLLFGFCLFAQTPTVIDFSQIPQEFISTHCELTDVPLQSSSSILLTNCAGTTSPAFNFTPNNNTLVKKFRLNFIFLNNDDGSGNFQSNNAEHQKIIDDAVNILNWKYSNLYVFPVGNACYESNNVGKTKIQFVVQKQYFSNTYEWDNENDCNKNGCPDRDNWYLKNRNDQINAAATGDDVGLNVFFTENQYFYNLLVLGQGTCPVASYSHPCTGLPDRCTPDISCSMFPSYNLNDFSSAHMRNYFTKYYTMKYLLAGSAQYPGTFFNANIGWGVDGDGDGNLYDNMYWWSVATLANGLAHELGHSFELYHLYTCKNIMDGGGSAERNFLNVTQLTTMHRSMGLKNIRKYIKDECSFNTTTQQITQNSTWDFDIKLYSNLEVTSNSTLTNTCKIYMPCSTLTHVASGSTLILDQGLLHLAPNASILVEGTLIIKSGGRLELPELSWCETMNNGKIIIEDGGEIVIYRGSRIVFQPNSELDFQNITSGKGIVFENTPSAASEPFIEIRGTLTIADYANFTYTGNGFIRFGLPFLSSTSNIYAGPNSKITLSGTGRDDKIAEIMDNTYLMPGLQRSVKFEIKDGSVLMGSSTQINVGNTDFLFNNVSFLKLGIPTHFGIKTNGWNNPINNITVIGVYVGITAVLNTGTGSQFVITNSVIEHCEIGIYTYDKGAVFSNVKLLNNTTGWKADAPVFKSTMNNCEVKYNQTGIEYNGGAGSSLYISASVLNNNTVQAVKVTGVEAKIRCSEMAGNGTGIFVGLNGTLNMGIDDIFINPEDNDLDHDGGWVNATSNGITIKTLFAQSLYLYFGFNNLVPITEGTKSIVNGTLGYPIDLIRVDYNRWKSNIINNPNPSTTRLVSGIDYKLGYYIKPADQWYRSTILNDPSPATNLPRCGTIPSRIGLRRAECPGCVSLFTKDFVGERLDNAISIALKKMSAIHEGCEQSESCHGNNVIREDRKAIDLFNQILMYRIPHPKPEEEELLLMAYQKMLRAISNAFLTGMMTREENSPVFSPELQMVVEVQDKLIQQANTGDTDYFKRLFVSMEKAQILRMAGRHDVSLPLLQQIDTWVRTEEKEWVEHWECWVRNEKLYYEGSVTPLEFSERIVGCGGVNASGARKAVTSGAEINNSNKEKIFSETSVKEMKESVKKELSGNFEFQIHPNPSQGLFKVIHNLDSDTKTLLEITDLRGKKVLALPASQIQSNSILNFTLLPQGVYLYHVKNPEGNGVNGKLVIVY